MSFPLQELLEKLEAANGRPKEREASDPMEELVSCILSQHTTDATSFPTFDALRQALPTWEQVAESDQERLAEIIRPAGLPNQKAKSILRCLSLIREKAGDYSLDHLANMSPREARAWLTEMPGVGPKTASIVLCFSFGMGVVPVDTHVHRVALRIGILPPKTDANRAHDILLEIVPPSDAYRFHMDLIIHGRKTCKAQRPSCSSCPVRALCKNPLC